MHTQMLGYRKVKATWRSESSQFKGTRLNQNQGSQRVEITRLHQIAS